MKKWAFAKSQKFEFCCFVFLTTDACMQFANLSFWANLTFLAHCVSLRKNNNSRTWALWVRRENIWPCLWWLFVKLSFYFRSFAFKRSRAKVFFYSMLLLHFLFCLCFLLNKWDICIFCKKYSGFFPLYSIFLSTWNTIKIHTWVIEI